MKIRQLPVKSFMLCCTFFALTIHNSQATVTSVCIGDPVLEYKVVHDMLAENDPTALVSIYEDGCVWVHYPLYMKKAGDYRTHLSTAEYRSLMQAVVPIVANFDTDVVKGSKTKEAMQSNTLSQISDSSTSKISVNAPASLLLDTGEHFPGARREVSWSNVQMDAERHPEISTLQEFAEAEKRLREIMDYEDLDKIE